MAELDLVALRTLQRLIGRFTAGTDLSPTLQAIADGVVEGLGFGAAVVNLVHPDDTVEVVNVAGPPDLAETLLGNRQPLSLWEKAFARAVEWGGLLFEPHEVAEHDEIAAWVPDIPVVEDDSAWHPLDALYAPLRSAGGELVGILSVDLPRDGRRPGPVQRELLEMYATQAGIAIDNARLTQRLRASEESFRLAFDNAPVGMSLVDLSPASAGRYLRVNEAMCRFLGYSRRELEEMSVADITHPDHRGADFEAIRVAMSGVGGQYEAEKRYLTASGTAVWVSVRSTVVRDEAGRALYAITQFEDVSARRAEYQELTRRARIDPLTGLLNRTALLERVEESVAIARASGRLGALLFCDLDDFKPVNDRHGHATGDRVLSIVAKRLVAQVRSGDTVARFGGDEFVIVADDLADDMLDELVARLQESVAAPMVADDIPVQLTVTIGRVRVTGATKESAMELIAAADTDMYVRKGQLAGRGTSTD